MKGISFKESEKSHSIELSLFILQDWKEKTVHTEETLSDIFGVKKEHLLNGSQLTIIDASKIIDVHYKLQEYL